MIITKVVKKEVKVQDKVICDICKQEIKESCCESSDIETNAKIGEHCPEGDYRTGYRLDVCKDCFLEKLKPLIETGLDVEFTEYDYLDYDGYYQ